MSLPLLDTILILLLSLGGAWLHPADSTPEHPGMQPSPTIPPELLQRFREDSLAVPAALGGVGFEKIAAAEGWASGSLRDEDLHLVADANAIKGGTITVSIDEYPATLRAYGKDEEMQDTRAINELVYQTLLETNPLDLGFRPALASHWKIDTAKQTYYFRIDPAARFSDGRPVTSADLIASYDLGSDPGILSPATNAFYQGYDRPVAVSPYMVSVRSKSRSWKDLLYFATATPILPAHVIGNLTGREYLTRYNFSMPAGSGPYIVTAANIDRGRSITLTRRADWWGAKKEVNRGRYNFDSIRLVVIRDERLQLERFKKGETDIYLVRRAQFWVEEFNFDEARRGLVIKQKVYNDGPTGFAGIAFNTRQAPFDDIRIRKAVGMLFNKKQIVERVMFNQYDMVNSLYPGSEYENPNNPKQEYNPQRASQLLAEAGYTSRNAEGILVRNGEPFEVDMLIYRDQERFLVPFQMDMQQAGIKVNLRTMDQMTWFTMLKEQNYQMALMGWGGLIHPNPKTSFHSDLADHTPSNNITAFSDPRVDQIVEAEQTEFDPARRRAMLREMDSIFSASYHYAYSWYAPYQRVVYWNRFGMPEYVLGRIGDWRDLLELWWVDPKKEEQLARARRERSVVMEHPASEANRFWKEWRR
jgi:microcin C transport system substrate-binding protein